MTHTDKQTTAGETYSSNTKEKQLNGWNRCELGDVILFQRGFDLPHRLRKAGSIPIVSSSGISGSHNKALVQAPGVVTGRYGTIGEVFYIEEPFWPLNTTLYVRDFKEITPEYTYHLLKTIDFASHSGKSGVPGVNRNDVHKEIVHIPVSKQEQTAIANVLSDSDALIDALEQLIAKKQAIKSATMQQLLTGRTRLPAFALRPDGTPKGYKPSELGDIPEDWEVLSLGCFGRTIRGVSYNPNHDLFLYDSSESIRLFRSNNIFESKIEKSELQYVSKSRVADHQVIMVGDILICMANGSKSLVGKSAFYSIDDGYKYTFGAFMGVYRASDNVNRQYVHYLMNTEWYRRYIDLVLAGSSINNLKPSHVDQISFAFPDIKEQTAIATILSDMDNELQVLTQKLEKARALKQGMMQQLLTGKIRLPLAAGA